MMCDRTALEEKLHVLLVTEWNGMNDGVTVCLRLTSDDHGLFGGETLEKLSTSLFLECLITDKKIFQGSNYG